MYPYPQNENSTLQIKYSKTNLPVPIIRGVQLHSLYDPVKEAENLIEVGFETLRNKKAFLVFGLGFGFHVSALLKKLQAEGIQADILVIEPEEEIYKKYLDHCGPGPFKVVAGKSIGELYQDQEFIDFLCYRPGIVKHPPSFNLHVQYFKGLLSYRAKNNLEEFRTICGLNSETELGNLINDFTPDTHIFEIAKYEIIENDYFLIGMLNAIGATVKESEA